MVTPLLRGRRMVEFEVVKATDIKFGKNNFIEISRKKVKSEIGEREFLAIARGFYMPDGSKRFRASITLPEDKDKIAKIADLLKKMK